MSTIDLLIGLEDELALAVHEGRVEDADRVEAEILTLQRQKAREVAAVRGAELAEQRRSAEQERKAREAAQAEQAAARKQLRKMVRDLDRSAAALAEALVRASALLTVARNDPKAEALIGVLREHIRKVEPRNTLEQRSINYLNRAAGSDGHRHPGTFEAFLAPFLTAE